MAKDKKTREISKEEKSLAERAFYSDNLLAFVYKKSERLGTALFMMTSFLPEDEPVRRDLREKSLSLLKNISGLDGSQGEVSVFGTKALKSFFEISSILDIAVSAGMITEMNYRIVKDVITELSDIVSSNFDIKNAKKSLLNPEFFSVKDIFLDEKKSEQKKTIKDIYQGQYYKRQGVLYDEKKEDISPYEGKKARKKSSSSNLSPKAKDRRETILKLLQNKDDIQVGDVSEVITSCSEKTIQRDLAKMVKEGILEKEGERRWSTYKLSK